MDRAVDISLMTPPALRGAPSRMGHLWRGLPWDGQGWAAGGDGDLVRLRDWSAAGQRGRVPALLRVAATLADRLGWAAAALARTLAFARRRGLRAGVVPRLYRACLLSGASPLEAWTWGEVHGGLHPLPARAAALLLPRLGDPAGHALLTDKLAAAACLAEARLSVPRLRAIVAAASRPHEGDLPAGTALFVKPRRGAGGRGAFRLEGGPEGWRVGDRPPVGWGALSAHLLRLAASDDLLVQDQLQAHPDLADLADAGRPPVLRLTTMRAPAGGAPRLHSALLEIPIPGRDPRHFLDGLIRAPVAIQDGTLRAGIRLGQPREHLAALPWNGARITGRPVPDYGAAAAAALAAMAAIPPVPLVSWDLVPTEAGPVLLEGNSCGNWLLTTLASVDDLPAPTLGSLLRAWRED